MFLLDKAKVTGFLITKKTKEVKHIRALSLFDHFLRVGSILESWRLQQETILAGMCHSLYSTEIFSTKIIDVEKEGRSELIDVVGEKVERVVYYFSLLDREKTLRNKDFKFFSYKNDEELLLDKDIKVQLLHILLANDFDHYVANFRSNVIAIQLGLYCKFYEELCDGAKKILDIYAIKIDENKDDEHFVRFIAHSGVQIKTEKLSIVIDPWLYDSTREKPVIRGVDTINFTIDYLIPSPRTDIVDIYSDIILLSHFHTHHSPLFEIKEIVKKRKVTIICPKLSSFHLERIEKEFGEYLFKRITFKICEKDEEFFFEGVSIKAFFHTHVEHLGFLVKTKKTSVMHLTDSKANKNANSIELDNIWKKIYNTRPDYLFISCGGHNLKSVNDGGVDIIENSVLTPVQAAKLIKEILPKRVYPIGVYNFSVWDNRIEYAMSNEDIENQLYWAVSFLSPSVKVGTLKPGDKFLFN